MNHQTKTRRTFIKNFAASGALAISVPQIIYAADKDENNAGENFTFLFQGDSITDGNRTRDNDWNHVMGHGYQYIIASKLW